jgi:hypothetical protein
MCYHPDVGVVAEAWLADDGEVRPLPPVRLRVPQQPMRHPLLLSAADEKPREGSEGAAACGQRKRDPESRPNSVGAEERATGKHERSPASTERTDAASGEDDGERSSNRAKQSLSQRAPRPVLSFSFLGSAEALLGLPIKKNKKEAFLGLVWWPLNYKAYSPS